MRNSGNLSACVWSLRIDFGRPRGSHSPHCHLRVQPTTRSVHRSIVNTKSFLVSCRTKRTNLQHGKGL